MGGNNPFQCVLLPRLLQGISLPPSELGAGCLACPCPVCSTRCHASPRVVGPRRPHVPHKRWLHRREKPGLASALPRPSSPSLARANRERVPAKRGPGGHRAAIWAVIHEHPSACSLTGRAGGHQAAPGAPLVPCRPQGRAPGVTPHQSHRAAAPRRTDMVWAQRALARGCSVGPCHHLELFYGGEPAPTGPPRPPCAARRALPVPGQRGRGAGQRCSRLLPSAAFCRMRTPGMGTPTLRGVGAAPCPRFMAPQRAARLRDGGAMSLGHVTVGGTWHCGGA